MARATIARRQSAVRLAGSLLAMSVLLCLSTPAYAWLRLSYEDATVVARSELIVRGHLLPGSIRYVPHKKKPHEGASWEHHATLVVDRVLKGQTATKRIPIIIHYGLTPVVGGYAKQEGFMVDTRRDSTKPYPQSKVEIVDTGNSLMGGAPMVPDAAKDHLWFLRRRSGVFGRKPGTGKLGIADPEDLQPRRLEPYLRAYLSSDPEQAVAKQMALDSNIRDRAQRYLDHLEIGRIAKLPNAKQRVSKLLPFYLGRVTWEGRSEARAGLIATGAAGPTLLRVFRDPNHRRLRQDIIRMWRQMKLAGAAPVLMKLLSKHDAFFRRQRLAPGWWNAPGHELQRDVYGEAYAAVLALEAIGDKRARQVIAQTRKTWVAINFDNPQIVEACDAALGMLAGP